MTPGINVAKKNKVSHKIHEYSHDETTESYGLEAAEKLGVIEQRIFKTLVVMLDDKSLAVGIIPVSAMLSMKLLELKKLIWLISLTLNVQRGMFLEE